MKIISPDFNLIAKHKKPFYFLLTAIALFLIIKLLGFKIFFICLGSVIFIALVVFLGVAKIVTDIDKNVNGVDYSHYNKSQ